MSDAPLRCCTLGLAWLLASCGVSSISPAADGDSAGGLEEIVITGSHIRGVGATGSKLTVIGREQIDASGYGRVEDILATVTQNFSGANQAVSEAGFFNLNHGSEVQLRGLGVGTTLTLVNGQRQGASGWQGAFTDLSLIPAAAVDRIEVLPEGASALYGADAIGGVVNVVLRKDFSGVEARVRGSTTGSGASERSTAVLLGHTGLRGNVLAGIQYNDSTALKCGARAYCASNGDYRRFGGTDLRSVAGNPGTLLDLLTLAPVAAIPHEQDGTQLTAAQLLWGAANYRDIVTDSDLLPRQNMRSAFLDASWRLTDHWQLGANGHYSTRDFSFTYPVLPNDLLVPASNAFNHLGGPVVIAYDLSQDFGPVNDRGPTTNAFLSLSANGALPHSWQINLSSAYARATTEFIESNFALDYAALDAALSSSDPAAALNVLGDGSHTNPTVLAGLREQNLVSDDLNVFTSTSLNVIADGPLAYERAGVIRLAVGTELRNEHSVGTNAAELAEDRRRAIRSAFFELAVPLTGPREGSTSDRLDMSLAGRFDHYSDVGGAFNPKIGFSWQPTALLRLRGNWGTSFLAPPYFFSNRSQVGDIAIEDVVDPRSPTGYSRALMLWGSMPEPKPETAHAWNVGVDLTPPAAPNASLSLTYFKVDYRGKIQFSNPFPDQYLTQEAQLASLIVRNPTQLQIDAVCQKPPIVGGTCDQPIAVLIDGRYRNQASLKTRGMDLALDHSLSTARGKLHSNLSGTYIWEQLQQVTPVAPVVDLVNTVGNPPRLRLVGNLSWTRNRWTAQGTLNYTGGYRDISTAPARKVDSWTTVDINIGYRLDRTAGGRANLQCNLGITNALDRRPPFVNRYSVDDTEIFGYDPANANIVGRQVSLQLVKHWGR